MADWSTILQAIGGPAIGSAITLYVTRRSDREKISAAIIWVDSNDRSGRPDSYPWLHIHNRSSQPAMVAEIATFIGVIRPRRANGCFPLEFEDPFDLRFPYRIEAGETKGFMLETIAMARAAAKGGRFAKGASFFRLPFLRIKVRTVAGTSVLIDATNATPWRDRPRWLQR